MFLQRDGSETAEMGSHRKMELDLHEENIQTRCCTATVPFSLWPSVELLEAPSVALPLPSMPFSSGTATPEKLGRSSSVA
jgi:hypothetical protein